MQAGTIVKSGNYWGVVLKTHHSPGGKFSTVKWANMNNPNYLISLQETNENPPMLETVTNINLLLNCKDIEKIVYRIKMIRSMVEFGYAGIHSTSQTIIDEITWRFHE